VNSYQFANEGFYKIGINGIHTVLCKQLKLVFNISSDARKIWLWNKLKQFLLKYFNLIFI